MRRLGLADIRAGLARGAFSAVELVEDRLAALEAAGELNAVVTPMPDRALEAARAADRRRAAGGPALPLDGVPVAVKDLFCTESVRTTASSAMLEGFVPPYESTVTANLIAAGAALAAKTNLDEFAMGSSTATSHFGPAVNPWKATGDARPRAPGGSSGGSAALVAASVVPAALGTDTGGSIRQPAAFCGIVGMKPTYGRCSRRGIVAFASSLDQAGPITRTVRDAAILLRAMAGHDPKDSTSVPRAVPDYEAALTGDIRGLRIGIPAEYRMDGTPDAIVALWERGKDWLKTAGAEIVDLSLPHTKYALPAYYIVAPAEASSNLARYDGVRFGLRESGDGSRDGASGAGDLTEMYEATRGAGFGAEVRRRILIGTYVLSAGYYDAYYIKAQRVRSLIARDFSEAFKAVDAILTPTTPTAAFLLGEKMDDPIAMYLNDVFTVPASMAGLPAISVPAGLNGDGLPLGLHLIADAFEEETLFRVAGVLEEAAGFTARPGTAG